MGFLQRRGAAFILLICLVALATLSPDRFADSNGARIIVLRNALLIDGTGTAAQPHMTVVIRGNRIQEIGPDPKVKTPKGAQTIDLQNQALLPGLIDLHVHLGLAPGGGQHEDETDAKEYPAKLAAYLLNGVTSIRSVGDFPEIFDLRSQERQVRLQSPRIFAVGPILTAVGGHPNKNTTTVAISSERLESLAVRIPNPEAGRAAVQNLIRDHKIDAVKIVYTGDNVRLPHLSYDCMAAIVDEAHNNNLRVVVHTDSLQDAKDVVRAGADGLEHGVDLPGVAIDDDLLAQMKAKGTYYVPTLAVQENFIAALLKPDLLEDSLVQRSTPLKWLQYLKDPNGRLQANIKRLQDNDELLTLVKSRVQTAQSNFHRVLASGVNFACGTDAGNLLTFYGLSEHRELELMVTAGATPMQAIQSATLFAARHLGHANELGTIERGKIADIFAVAGDPSKRISDTRNVRLVIKDGQVVDLYNLILTINP